MNPAPRRAWARRSLLVSFPSKESTMGIRAFLVACLLLSGPAARAGTPAAADEAKFDQAIVRVYFESLKVARAVARTFEPIESHYEKGYLLLEVSEDERRLLVERGLRVEDDAEAAERYARFQGFAQVVDAIPGFTCYRTVEETHAAAQALATNNPTLATWSDIGDSWEKTAGLGGHDIRVLKLTNSAIAGPKPKLLINAAIHAREYTTAELALRFAESLVSGYGTDADATWLLDQHEAHFVFQSNPDGRKKAEAGALWRKNTNQNYCGATSSSRGVDLNRNFAFMWGCCNGSSTSQCSETYRGPSAASDPETKTLQNYMTAIFPDQRGPNMTDAAPPDATGIFIDLHSSGRLMLWPWGMTTTVAPNGTALQTFGRKMAFFNGHTPEQSVGLYPTDGATDDHAYGTLGVAAYTYELGTQFFESCTYFQNTLLPANLPALKYALKAARTPYQTPAGPETVSVALSAGATTPGVPAGTVVTLTASLNDTRYNNSNGTEPSQAVAAAEYYVDTPPWRAGAVAVPMSASDGSFNTSVEGATASVNTTGFASGRHILYVRGRDASGNWGAFSASFLYVSGSASPDFSVACSPSSVSAAPGASVNTTCTVTSTGGFVSAVSLSCAGAPAGVTCSYAPSAVTPPANGSVNSTLTIAIAAGTPAATSTFQARGTSGATARNANVTLTITGGGGGGAQTAVYDTTLRAPKCAAAGTSCDSGASLLLGRATKGPEPNQPNVLGTCADGTSGTFHVDESNDRLKIATVDGSTLAAGKQVRVEATVWAYSSFTADKLDLYYAANANAPTWTLIGTLTPTAAGAQTLSATYTLPAGALQAVRAQFRYQGSAGTCTTGGYNDRDDLVFAVQ
jgi:hypothetical protein